MKEDPTILNYIAACLEDKIVPVTFMKIIIGSYLLQRELIPEPLTTAASEISIYLIATKQLRPCTDHRCKLEKGISVVAHDLFAHAVRSSGWKSDEVLAVKRLNLKRTV